MRLVFHAEAEREARQQVEWYASHSQPAAERLAELFISTAERIAKNPLQFPLMEGLENPGNVRRARFDDFPIVMVYQTLEDVAFVVSVAHTSRKPWYWQARLQPKP